MEKSFLGIYEIGKSISKSYTALGNKITFLTNSKIVYVCLKIFFFLNLLLKYPHLLKSELSLVKKGLVTNFFCQCVY